MPAVIEVQQLHKSYGETVAVDDVSFDVQEGEIFGILGPNGAGNPVTELRRSLGVGNDRRAPATRGSRPRRSSRGSGCGGTGCRRRRRPGRRCSSSTHPEDRTARVVPGRGIACRRIGVWSFRWTRLRRSGSGWRSRWRTSGFTFTGSGCGVSTLARVTRRSRPGSRGGSCAGRGITRRTSTVGRYDGPRRGTQACWRRLGRGRRGQAHYRFMTLLGGRALAG